MKIVPNSVMLTTQFGDPVYIGPLGENFEIQITDKKEEATHWHNQWDATKLEYHKAVTGLNLEFKPIN